MVHFDTNGVLLTLGQKYPRGILARTIVEWNVPVGTFDNRVLLTLQQRTETSRPKPLHPIIISTWSFSDANFIVTTCQCFSFHYFCAVSHYRIYKPLMVILAHINSPSQYHPIIDQESWHRGTFQRKLNHQSNPCFVPSSTNRGWGHRPRDFWKGTAPACLCLWNSLDQTHTHWWWSVCFLPDQVWTVQCSCWMFQTQLNLCGSLSNKGHTNLDMETDLAVSGKIFHFCSSRHLTAKGAQPKEYHWQTSTCSHSTPKC